MLYASESYDDFPQRSPVEAYPLTAGDEDESRASVDDASRGGKDGLAAVGDRLIDTPVLARGEVDVRDLYMTIAQGAGR